jgi:hypothetical protein
MEHVTYAHAQELYKLDIDKLMKNNQTTSNLHAPPLGMLCASPSQRVLSL